jgi:cell division protein FtsB
MSEMRTSDIEIKIRSTIDYFLQENISISIARVCEYAEVSRANLYTTYPNLIKDIKSFKPVRSKPKVNFNEANINTLKLENQKLKSQVKLLSYTCIELRTALDEELRKTKQLQDELKNLNRK